MDKIKDKKSEAYGNNAINSTTKIRKKNEVGTGLVIKVPVI